ncbi:g8756 [Coccomyxa viridis]|uniref:G8756 protein n=1 Tax=Coccomyxa viridis TaxID=1274662 RepID=A0ABP1G5A8_9CHLO
MLPCYQQRAVSKICATHDAFTLAGSTPDALTPELRDLLANLDELLTPVELRDIEELLMPEIDEAPPEGRLERAREIVGTGLLSEAAEKHAEAAFTVWMDNVQKSYTYRSQDLCMFNTCDLVDEIVLYEWSPGAMMDWDGTEDDDVPLYSGPLHPDAQAHLLTS